MALHLINARPDASSCYEQCRLALNTGDAVLLLEDAVYAATGTFPQRFTDLPGITLYVLEPDMLARGIGPLVSEHFTPVSDSQFVELCCQQDKVISWS
ncbi:sulfurtransferase complex subunit TusB [Pontibacter sp. JAM-7]|uniref:sulfurtransferase complex subunit TusB n=1 Tax=Pontibacter sp. JAM-7 TaxID=3366581 RepID=UPI003AF5A043